MRGICNEPGFQFLRDLASHPAFINGEVETGFISVSPLQVDFELSSKKGSKKHHDSLFPVLGLPPSYVVAQAALYKVLQDHERTRATPWTSLAFRRFGGDVYQRIITFQTTSSDILKVHVTVHDPCDIDISIHRQTGEVIEQFTGLDAALESAKSVLTTFPTRKLKTTIIAQVEHHGAPSFAFSEEKLHVFYEGTQYVLTSPSPAWLLSLGEDAQGAGAGGIRAPMPSLIVDVKVKLGEKVKKGQAIVILESMKTETVLRAEADGMVKSISCSKGDMVEEGKELALIEA